MQYPWHPFFGKTFDILLHFSRKPIPVYRCRPSDQPEKMRLDMPVWMFDPVKCSNMKLLEEPFCSLEALSQLQSLLREASSVECIIDETQNTFDEKGDANAESQLKTQNNRLASVSPTQYPPNNLEESIQAATNATDGTHEQYDLGAPKTSRRKP